MNKLESLISCNTCKIRKVKCGRELPECSYCSEYSILCIYPDKIRKRRISKAGLSSTKSKLKPSSSVQYSKLTYGDGEKNETIACKLILFQPIPQPIDFSDESSQAAVTKVQLNCAQKFQTHILLLLSTQILNYDSRLIPQIDFFVSRLELNVLGKLLKFSIHMNQDWIVELLSPSFEEKCISSYFQYFHPVLTCISKYKFYTNFNVICPILKSVIILIGYSNTTKPSPELLKYLKHLAIVQLKKNMFKVRVSVCQAMFIFSYYLIFKGLGKQSLEYFHQAYIMASALGIDKDMPGLNEMDRDERRCTRFASYKLDSHLCIVIKIQPRYLFLAPSWAPLNPIYQTNPDSKDSNEFLIAECICLSIKCYNMYWNISANLMNKYSQLTLANPQSLLKDSNNRAIYILQTLYSYSLIRTLDLHLNLSGKCKNSEELEIVKNYAKMHVRLYHNTIIILNSQFTPANPTLELDQSTKKLLHSAEALYQNSINLSPLCIPILHHNLCSLSLLYIKLILIYNHVPQLKIIFLEKFKQVYKLFNSYRSKYNMSPGMIEVIDIIVNYYKYKFNKIENFYNI
ncbi:hypothetical protein CONCODRAFT_9627 [Conidiobolus coronatus NRRL 28638]|uniref:Zn(2)-C6 fungal-type domain-containing protein n=1 Tax=Conidiobolus coronatus (strain ATCC 28846 / CBS 209.66 / NRRL 28638) TaxID=796925 RepID=A0A137NZV8_CONC2|nr:hypothetical protein CONCODRAFT_9627 [Conidiobolus coronatus NRRL 28638]|eukprot:KXN68154.1 hypothetical protein CONCODRAFT_9627 [Conidiobolus coronatus NRRL 28638]